MKNLILLLLLLAPLTLIALRRPSMPEENSCLSCHEDLIKNKVVHPITEQGCQFCHTANGEKHPGKEKGFDFTAGYPDMCYMCHEEKNVMENVHSPVAEGDCSICHSPHSSPYPSLILEDFSDNSCLDCHYMETDEARTIHGPVKNGECQDCHDPHQSEYPFQVKKESLEMCLTCHFESIKTEKGELDAIGEHIVPGYDIHEPIVNGECTLCHFPHSSGSSFLLLADYPIKQYSEATVENFNLCFRCHDSQLMTADSTTTVTQFRNGTKNLHSLHIKGNRGRNCNLCHNAHGAPNKHILENYVMFGKWEMPMGLELTETGGSCATGCHKRLEYNRLIE